MSGRARGDPAERGTSLVEVLASSAILLLITLSLTQLVMRIGQDQVGLSRGGAALHRARIELEREAGRAVADSTAYLSLSEPPSVTVIDVQADIKSGQITVTRSLKSSNLFDIAVQIEWLEDEGAAQELTLFTSVWKR